MTISPDDFEDASWATSYRRRTRPAPPSPTVDRSRQQAATLRDHGNRTLTIGMLTLLAAVTDEPSEVQFSERARHKLTR